MRVRTGGLALETKKVALFSALAVLVVGTIGIGLFFKHYFVVSAFAVWLVVEYLLWRSPLSVRFASQKGFPSRVFLKLYREGTPAADKLLSEKITMSLAQNSFPGQERWLGRLRALLRLRSLAFSPESVESPLLARWFLSGQVAEKDPMALMPLERTKIAESATLVAELYWKLYDISMGEYPELAPLARALYSEIFDEAFDLKKAQERIVPLVDGLQRGGGVPFLLLKWVEAGHIQGARELASALLKNGIRTEDDEELYSSLYWMTEILWFGEGSQPVIQDFETSIRYLYHVCFTHLHRASFLEIDSQYLSHFENVNDLAREGLLYKEILIEKVLALWGSYPGAFDSVFQKVMEALTGQSSKIYDSLEFWKSYWEREADSFLREYLYLVEGNICYANGQFGEATHFYERALKHHPGLRAAKLNLLFSLAQEKQHTKHAAWVEEVEKDAELMPSSLYMIGNSYICLGDSKAADAYYAKLAKVEGWDKKVDHYRSTFCYESGRYGDALVYAKRAAEQNPTDLAFRYHLSLCHSALGEKESALDVVDKLGPGPEWIDFYRFTLERDVGRHQEASRTLMNLPTEYFEDPEELNAAMDFAKLHRDLVLLRHLRRKEK